jgi:hypothetical protein
VKVEKNKDQANPGRRTTHLFDEIRRRRRARRPFEFNRFEYADSHRAALETSIRA